MLSLLCVLQLSATVPLSQAPLRFETFVPVLPVQRLPMLEASMLGEQTVAVDTPRTIAIEYSDGYYKRLAIHRYASYATIPLFVLQYLSGQELIKNGSEGSWAKSVHGPVAIGVAALFGVNTVTGVWNLYASRKDPNGRTRRTVHSLLMLVADAGFVWTGASAPGDDEGQGSSRADRHKTLAITSGSIALASYLMMLIWKD